MADREISEGRRGQIGVAQGFAPAIQRASSAAAAGALALAGLAWAPSSPPRAVSRPAPAAIPSSPRPDPEGVEPDRPSRRQVIVLELARPPALPSWTAISSAGGNGFYYGYCTWWVAQKRPIPWRGDAWQWWANAQLLGYPEGGTARPGAVAVFKISGRSPAGHVAYVEAVNPDGTFVVSEMNWGAFGVMDVRTITSLSEMIGFIY